MIRMNLASEVGSLFYLISPVVAVLGFFSEKRLIYMAFWEWELRSSVLLW